MLPEPGMVRKHIIPNITYKPKDIPKIKRLHNWQAEAGHTATLPKRRQVLP